jgi:hypothetical protein
LSTPPPPPTALETTLNRPLAERVREYKYRFAQSAVFGLPVLALQYFGPSLGGAEAWRWIAVLQTLLAGWVIYVAAAGMLFEGLLLLARRRLTPDLVPAAAGLAFYTVALVRSARLIIDPASHRPVPTYDWAILCLVVWTGLRWWLLAKKEHARR